MPVVGVGVAVGILEGMLAALVGPGVGVPVVVAVEPAQDVSNTKQKRNILVYMALVQVRVIFLLGV